MTTCPETPPKLSLKRRQDLELENQQLCKRVRELEKINAPLEDDGNCPVCLEPNVRRGGKALLSCGSCGVQMHLDCAKNLFQAPQKFKCPSCRQQIVGIEMKLTKWKILIGKLWYRNSPVLSDKGSEFAQKGQVVRGVLICRDGMEWIQNRQGFLPLNTAEGQPLATLWESSRMLDRSDGVFRCTSCGWEIVPDTGCQCQLHTGGTDDNGDEDSEEEEPPEEDEEEICEESANALGFAEEDAPVGIRPATADGTSAEYGSIVGGAPAVHDASAMRAARLSRLGGGPPAKSLSAPVSVTAVPAGEIPNADIGVAAGRGLPTEPTPAPDFTTMPCKPGHAAGPVSPGQVSSIQESGQEEAKVGKGTKCVPLPNASLLSDASCLGSPVQAPASAKVEAAKVSTPPPAPSASPQSTATSMQSTSIDASSPSQSSTMPAPGGSAPDLKLKPFSRNAQFKQMAAQAKEAELRQRRQHFENARESICGKAPSLDMPQEAVQASGQTLHSECSRAEPKQQIQQIAAMGFSAVRARNALDAANGSVEIAVSLLLDR